MDGDLPGIFQGLLVALWLVASPFVLVVAAGRSMIALEDSASRWGLTVTGRSRDGGYRTDEWSVASQRPIPGIARLASGITGTVQGAAAWVVVALLFTRASIAPIGATAVIALVLAIYQRELHRVSERAPLGADLAVLAMAMICVPTTLWLAASDVRWLGLGALLVGINLVLVAGAHAARDAAIAEARRQQAERDALRA
jgi:hypothetical protein